MTYATARSPLVLTLLGVGLVLATSAVDAAGNPTVDRRHVRDLAQDAALGAGEHWAPAPLDEAFGAVNTVKDVAAVAAGTATVHGVAGSSAATILGTLNVAGGPLIVGGGAGFGLAGLQAKYLYSDCADRNACDAAAVSGYVGAGVGTAAAVGLAGTYGVGAAGLAGIGTLVGGGMAAGAVTLVALPAVGVIAFGGGAYALAAWLFD
ncbi:MULTISPECIES: hypothetical protein [unclassified Thiocapsa]|uniref:hypothetical protein n=1 Tax=unclassified Thiocapsa TaxID=2641286 RepID=UPI0035B379E4